MTVEELTSVLRDDYSWGSYFQLAVHLVEGQYTLDELTPNIVRALMTARPLDKIIPWPDLPAWFRAAVDGCRWQNNPRILNELAHTAAMFVEAVRRVDPPVSVRGWSYRLA
ncbi:hypothetical protein LCGC14_3152470, partial [marine sediment metagenome]